MNLLMTPFYPKQAQILGCLLAMFVLACDDSGTAEPTKSLRKNSGTGAIEGTVVANLLPGNGLSVSQPLEQATGVAKVKCTVSGTNYSAETDDTGYFQILAVEPGSYILICKRTVSGEKSKAWLNVVDVQAGQTTDLGIIVIKDTGGISGHVKLLDQSDASGVLVYCAGRSYDAHTDQDGHFIIDEVAIGSYSLVFEKDGYDTIEIPVVVESAKTTKLPATVRLSKNARCKNGIQEGLEQCDGSDMGGKILCADVDLGSGRLSCDEETCRYNTADCSQQATCGNGIVEGLEQCDDNNTVTEDCAPGQTTCIVCDAFCKSLTREIPPVPALCGDGIIQAHEACDGINLGQETCSKAGILQCAKDCSVIDRSQCQTVKTSVPATIIQNEVTWRKENSPYQLQGNIEIAKDARLLLEPGVIIDGQNANIMVWGTITAAGTAEENIILKNVTMRLGSSAQKAAIELAHAVTQGGSMAFGHGHGRFVVQHSRILQPTHPFYLRYPDGDCSFQNNLFVGDNASLKIGIGNNVNVYIRYNEFIGDYAQPSSPAIQTWASSGNSKVYAQYNDFSRVKGYALALGGNSATETIIGDHNYWGTTDTSIIDQKIYDKNDSLDNYSVINYQPILQQKVSSPSPTVVGGIISEDTTWRFENSPYNLKANVEIDKMATLTIEPGVVVNGYAIVVWGTVHAVGTSGNRITFNNVNLKFGSSAKKATINLEYATINKGSISSGDGYGKFWVRKSKIIEPSATSYIRYPDGDSYFEGNLFSGDNAALSIGIGDSVNVYIKYNKFVGSYSQSYPAIETWASSGSSKVYAQYNDFSQVNGYALGLGGNTATETIVGDHNYWGTSDATIIGTKIYDRLDTNNNYSVIQFDPVLSESPFTEH